MQGLMMDTPLMIPSLVQYAEKYHRDTKIVFQEG